MCLPSPARPWHRHPAEVDERVPAGGQLWEDRPVVPADFHDFFLSSAGVAGALIGLLFVAISVAGERLANAEGSGQLHRIRAVAALTSFINALTVSLFALLPGEKIGVTSLVVAVVGLAFVSASLLSLIRLRQVRWSTVRDGLFLVGLLVTFIYQFIAGLSVANQPDDSGSVDAIAILVIVSFIVGISRAWELIGGPSIGIRSEVFALVRSEVSGKDGSAAAAGSTEAEDAPSA